VVKAVSSDGAQACVPSFTNVNRSVSFWSEYVSPLAPSSEPAARVTVSHGASNNLIGTAAGSATPITLSFNANGEATIGMNYADAGQLNLNARYSGSAATNDAGLEMSGADQFVSAPHGLCISAEQYCATANAECPIYKKAGQSFTTTISARAWQNDTDTNFCDNATTPSFSRSGIPLSHSLVQPVGGVTGTLTPNSYNHLAQTNAQTPVNMSISEVGIFNLQAGSNLTYLGFPITLGSSMINPLGRLVPDRFELASGSSISGSCGSFHYLSQPANLTMTVRALNVAGGVTANYRGSFAKATSSLVAENNNNGTDLTSRIEQLSSGMNWVNGVSTRTAARFSLLRAANADGPFEQVLFGLQLQDNDGNVSQLAGKDQLTTAAGICIGAACLSKVIHSETKWRYGRLQIVNALGSEQSNLPVQLKAEYWNGQQFVPNTADSCSPVQRGLLQVTPITPGAPVLTVSGSSNGTLQNGSSAAFDLLLPAPGIESSYQLQYLLGAFPWLQYDWVPNNGQLSENPTGEAVFGGFRGNNRQIFWREN
jgi:MSHA biogenesis protein MshQ